jgi:hypothetical protein
MTTIEEEIDLTYITRNGGPPTLISITKARRGICRHLQTRVCADPHTHDHGHSYLVWNNSDWLKKRQVTAPITPPTNPGAYDGTNTTFNIKARSPQGSTTSMEMIQSSTGGNKEDDNACLQVVPLPRITG